MRLLAALSVSAVLCLASAAPAVAADPGSAIDQYRENIPSGGSAKKPSAKERKSLESQGEDGRQLAEVLGAAGSGSASGGPEDASTGSGGTSGGSAGSSGGTGSGSGGGSGTRRDTSAGDRGRAGDAASSGDADQGVAGSTDGRSGGSDSGGATSASDSGDSPVSATVAASLGSDFGPAKLWVALVAILVAALGVAVVRRRSA